MYLKCYAIEYCKKDKSECNENCGGYRVLRALYRLSRMPVLYQHNIALIPNDEDIKAFEELNTFKEAIVDNVQAGKNLYIWGKNTGCGKTSWACKIMSYYFRKIAFSSGLEFEGLYIFLPTFLEDLRDSYNNPSPEFDEELEMVKKSKLLIIDDIGAENVTSWVRERVVSIINTRVSNGLSTIYTSNLSPAELTEAQGDRIASRVLGGSQIIEITGTDRRGVK
jgi:DNA replication protein DnaC